MFSGVTAKFSPFRSSAVSASLRDLEDKLITQLVLSRYGVSAVETAACFSCISFSNFCFCLSLVVLKTRWVLILICSSILSASSGVRADVMLCDVDSASFFASPLAFCVSLILSLRNLIDASSATLRAPFVGTGVRTCRSLGTMRLLMHLVRKVRKVRWFVKRASLLEQRSCRRINLRAVRPYFRLIS